MFVTGQTIDLAVTTTGASGAVALRRVADLLAGQDLTPAMGCWVRRLAAAFSSWHDTVVRAAETHPAFAVAYPASSVEVPITYVESISALTGGLGPRLGRDGVVPVAVALVDLAGSFESTFAAVRRTHPEVYEQLAVTTDLAPVPFGSGSGVTAQFVSGVSALLADVTDPDVGAPSVRARIDEFDRMMLDAIDWLRRVGSSSGEMEPPRVSADFDPARVAALAGVLQADASFSVSGGTGRIGRVALATSADFAAVTRTDERVAAGFLVAEAIASAAAVTGRAEQHLAAGVGERSVDSVPVVVAE